jgi:hypothetical protein
MRRTALAAAAVIALAAAGGASAYALHTIMLRPGHCTKVHGTKVCARKVTPRTFTVTVAPSPIGQMFSGNGDVTLAPMTLAHGVNVSSEPNDAGYVHFDNGNSTTSGTSYVPPGTYTFDVGADGAWTLSF